MRSEAGGRDRPLFRVHSALLAGLLCLVALAAFSASAHAYTFGAPVVSQAGAEFTTFDWTTMACQNDDIPDIGARAFRDSFGRTQLIVSHWNTRREISPAGGNLNDVAHNCAVVFTSDGNSNPSNFNYQEWLHTTYTLDGSTVYGLVHNEFHGWDFFPECEALIGSPDINKCWYNTITFATSTNSGLTYTQAAQPNHFLAGVPYQYVSLQGPTGLYRPSNIMARSDGYYYFMAGAQADNRPGAVQESGMCVFRTKTLDVPSSWRAWDGNAYTVRMINPYTDPDAGNPAAHVCKPVSTHALRGMEVNSLTYNTYFGKYMVVGTAVKDPTEQIGGFYVSLSDDLLHWTEPILLMEGEVAVTHECGDPSPVRDGALLDPNSPASDRNYEKVGQTANLYFTRFNYFNDVPGGPCSQTLDRDLIKIPVQFSGTPPTASFTHATYSPDPDIGDTIVLDSQPSSDPDGSIVQRWWDLDGDGMFEVLAGGPTVPTSSDKVSTSNVGLRVIDDDGLIDELHKPLLIGAQVNFQPDWTVTPASYVKDKGAAYTDAVGYGWVRQDSLQNPTHTPLSLTANVTDRDPYNFDSYSKTQDTALLMQYPTAGSNPRLVKTPGAFEIAAPCGVYQVTVSVGDSSFASIKNKAGDVSTHRINIEGQNAIAGFVPTDETKFATATRTVGVCDGRLTIDAIGGTNTKLNYVDVQPMDPKIDFQPSWATTIPTTHARDTGSAYTDTRGYGWVRQDSLSSLTHTPLDLSSNTTDRDPYNVDQYPQTQDTVILMQYPTAGSNPRIGKTPGAFEVAAPCGNYDVTVSVGDSAWSSINKKAGDVSTHRINIEGQNAIAGFVPTDQTKFSIVTKQDVNVCDGRITIDAIGGTNTKLNYVEIARDG